jgi:alpha-amylase
MKGVMLQFFHWYHPGNLWNEFSEKINSLQKLGFTSVWLPPAAKCHLGTDGRGYDVYDLYDLGEFDQKGGIPTRYGTKEEYIQAIDKAHQAGISVYADVVLNHRMGADEYETVKLHQVEEEDRNETLSKVLKLLFRRSLRFRQEKESIQISSGIISVSAELIT